MVLLVSTFTDWFNRSLDEREWGVRQFAQKAGVSHTAVVNWMRGAKPSPENCDKIARAFRVPVSTVRDIAGYGPVEDADRVLNLTPDEDLLVRAWRIGAPSVKRLLRDAAELAIETQTDPE